MHKPFSFSGFEKIVQRLRVEIRLPSTFTLDACRHGGMTELEEAELTDGQGRALSGHKTKQAMLAMPSKRLSGRCLLRASDTRTDWRTPREQIFRMASGNHFRMNRQEQSKKETEDAVIASVPFLRQG